MHYLFGNPGSTELPLIDALAGADDLHYVLALQEATAVAMADGYAQASGRPAFLNLHTSAGLGNAIGNLTNAQANRAPLVVTAGQQDVRHLYADPLLAGDLVGLARPVSKWAHEVRTPSEVPIMLRRAFHDAASPPAGPVFVSLPMSILEYEGDVDVPPPSAIRGAAVPTPDVLAELADQLNSVEPGRLAVVVGDEVGASAAAVTAAVALAERLNAPVFAGPLHSTGVFPPGHPCFAGVLPPTAAGMRAALAPYRRVAILGGRVLMAYPYTDGSALPDGIEVIHVSPDPAQVGRWFAAGFGVVADVGATMQAVLPLLVDRTGDLGARREEREAEIGRLESAARDRYGASPIEPMAAGHALVRSLPPDSVVVDEAITTGTYVRGFHHWTTPGRYYFCKGGGLGWGMPAALGVSLALEQTPILCVVGDGSAMYSPQALWTAARENLPVVFAVVNNRQYLILKRNLRQMKGQTITSGRYVAMDLDRPPVDYVGLSRAMGVDATLVTTAGDIGDAVRAALASGRPHLLEIPIAATS